MENEKEKFWQTQWFTWLTLILFPIIGLVVLWGFNKHFDKKKKIILTVIFVFWMGIISSVTNDTNMEKTSEIPKNNTVKVTVTDFSSMSQNDAQQWCNTNKMNCTIKEEYSDSVKKDDFIEQSNKAGSNIAEGSKIIITYSLGKKPSIEFLNALAKANTYSENMHMSKKSIYEQLISEYGEGFTKDAAQYAIDNLKANYNYNALQKAKEYSKEMHMSKNAIYEQLISEYGEKFTPAEAKYAIDNFDKE